MSLIPGSSCCPVAQRGTPGLQHQLPHCTNTTWDSSQCTGRLSKPATGRDQPTPWLHPSSSNTSASARTHTLPEFRWQPVPEPSPAWHRSTTAKLPPNCIQAASCRAVRRYPKGGRFVQKAGACPGTGRSLLRPAPALTFLTARGSALLGALASKKLRLLATPSEDSTRLF